MSALYSAFSDLADAFDEREELRAEAREQRRRMRPHWCTDCLGFSGGPCDQEPDPEPADEPESEED